MSYLQSMPDRTTLLEILKAYPDTARPLCVFHQMLLRGESPLSVAQRELIAAFVSGVNACEYCHGVHTQTAAAFGVSPQLLETLFEDVDAADIEPEMKPVLRYVRKLTLTPAKMTPADVQAVFDAGWNDQALHDIVSICALFNMMNRLVDGLGVSGDADYFKKSGQRLHDGGYEGLIRILDEN